MKFEAVADRKKVDRQGRVHIPKLIREKVKAVEGEYVEVLVDEDNKAILIRLEKGA